MIYKGRRISKISVTKDQRELDEDLDGKVCTWEDSITPFTLDLRAVDACEPYTGNGGNGIDDYGIPNKDITIVYVGRSFHIIEKYEVFIKELEEYHNFRDAKEA
jgi:hypothetical protein